jgi:1,4-dihydroxy-2-naphthoate octaprenyltransferase
MKNQEVPKSKDAAIVKKKIPVSSQVIAAESVQAEEVPTIPLDSLQTLSTLQPEVEVRAMTATRVATLPEPLVVQPAEYRRSPGEWARIWWDGIRPYYLWFAALPLLLGSVLGWLDSITARHPLGNFHPQRLAVALAAVFLLQIGACWPLASSS